MTNYPINTIDELFLTKKIHKITIPLEFKNGESIENIVVKNSEEYRFFNFFRIFADECTIKLINKYKRRDRTEEEIYGITAYTRRICAALILENRYGKSINSIKNRFED